MRKAFCALAGLLLASTANAASIQYEGSKEGLNIVTMDGQIVEGDAAKFDLTIAQLIGRTVIVLTSPGGGVAQSLAIGATIRARGFATAVPAGMTCASACGLIWLAGNPRILSNTSRIGFHAAYRADGTESGAANALAGAYLNELGLPPSAIVFITQSPPDGMTWLHPSDATQLGITYALIPTEPSAPAPSPNFSQGQPTQPSQTPAQQQAVQLVLGINAYWSQGGTNVEAMAQYYAPMVSFYGSSTMRENIMVEKRKFSARWPVRHYTVDQRSLFVQCAPDGCSVTGVLTWDCTSLERGQHSVGTANFAYRIVNGVITSENGSVLTNHAETVNQQQQQQQALPTSAYAQGRQARTEYEQWVNGLSDGEFKQGVLFWAAHRGDKPQPPSCTEGSSAWQRGCQASRAVLTPSDLRRMTEKDFWYGWNSL